MLENASNSQRTLVRTPGDTCPQHRGTGDKRSTEQVPFFFLSRVLVARPLVKNLWISFKPRLFKKVEG